MVNRDRMIRRIIAALLIFVLLFSALPGIRTQAADRSDEDTDSTGSLTEMLTGPESRVCVNPVYRDELSEADIRARLKQLLQQSDAASSAEDGTISDIPQTYEAGAFKSIEEAGEYLKSEMKKRSNMITITFDSAAVRVDYDIEDRLFDYAFTHTGVPTEGDYLRLHYGGRTTVSIGSTMMIGLVYYTNADQEAVMDERVCSVLWELGANGMSDEDAVKAVYDYICENVTYDYANLNNDLYDLKYSAYAALVDGTAVCQGYATLMYRLLLELGIDCRVITGIGIAGFSGGPHAWNIVRLGKWYYNMDSTWDADCGSRDYFLKSHTDFPGHFREEQFDTDAFHMSYPMADSDYVFGRDGSGRSAERDEILPFSDVRVTDSYYDKVKWAVDNGIVAGTTATTFSPNNPCTRYQFTVMLYKLAGKPQVSGMVLPFTDVQSSASYYPAVCWAYSQNIIAGTTRTTFSPNAAVTRYQVVQMLYKMAGKPQVYAINPFTDVKETDSFYPAVLWAVDQQITSGTTPSTFSPQEKCKRYQMVVFLNKYNNIYHLK